MSTFLRTLPTGETGTVVERNPWTVALGVLAGVLVVGGAITATVGLSIVANLPDVVLGQEAAFDRATAASIVGGVAVVLGIAVGTCWLVVGAAGWRRSA